MKDTYSAVTNQIAALILLQLGSKLHAMEAPVYELCTCTMMYLP